MAPKLLGIMVSLLSAAAGCVIGALSRQPEINKLKKRIKQLQKEVERLQELCRTQDEQLNVLMLKYKALKIFQFSKKNEARTNIRGVLVYQYAVHDYLTLLLMASRKEKLKEEDVIFYNIFDKVIEGQEVCDEERNALKEYITYRHTSELRGLRLCDNTGLIQQIQNLDIRKM